MKIIVDKINVEPPHALTLQDVRALFRVVPEAWKTPIDIVHLKATLPENTRFSRPVIFLYPNLNVCCRGLSAERARKEILREVAVIGLSIPIYYGRQMSDAQLKQVDTIIAPLLKQAQADADAETV